MRVISGYLKGRELLGYNVETTRPTMSRVKESMFASIQNYIDDSIILDLFCGTGSLGIEALSMGASRCYFVDNNKDILRYLDSIDVKYDVLANKDSSFSDNLEYLNGYQNKDDFNDLESILKNKKKSTKICLLDVNNYDLCLKKKYYLVFSSLASDNKINDILSNISSGEIILIKKSTSLSNMKLIISEINRQDLKIVFLSELISES